MDSAIAELIELQSLKELKPILNSPGPCVSVYMTFTSSGSNTAKANELEWKETIRTIEPKLQELGAEGRQLLAGLSTWEGVTPSAEKQGKTLVVLRSPSGFHVTWLQEQVKSCAEVGPHFYIRPLLGELTKPKKFYILALSQKNVRLLKCTLRSAEEVTIPNGTYTSFDRYMDTAKPDHNSSNDSSAGPSAGHTKGILASTSTVREDKPEYLGHFFKQIDRGVNECLRGSSTPLVLAAVEYELAQYKSLNTYGHLSAENVQGAPNSLKSGEMHARAIEALAKDYDMKADDVLAEYNHRVGAGASNRLNDVVTAARDGRVLHLLVSDNLEKTAAFDEETNTVKSGVSNGKPNEDLVNDAAVQTILHAGQVFCVSNKKMPNGAQLAAVFRY